METPRSPAAVLAQRDIHSERQEYVLPVPQALHFHAMKAIEDPRDLPALSLLLNIITLVVPLAVGLHLLPSPSHGLGVAYLAFNYGLFLQRFLLTLHYTEHRRLFRSGRDPTQH
jgi:hypothetical protein